MINIPKLLISSQKDLIQNYINELSCSYNIKISNIKWLETKEYNEIYNALFQITLFDELNIFVIDLDYFYKNNTLDKEMELLILELYNNPISHLVYFYSKFNNVFLRKKFKEIIKLEELDEKNKLSYIKEHLIKINLKLNNDQLNLLNKRLLPNRNIIKNEINKLNINNLHLIDQIIYDYSEEKPYMISEIILKNNVKELNKLLNSLVVDIDSYHKIFNIVSNKLVNLFLIKQLLSKKMNAKEISVLLNKSIYSINADINLINSVSFFTVEYYINVLYRIEKDIRQKNLDPIKTLKINLIKGMNNKW